MHVHVRDGGMQLLSAVVPDFRWDSGSAMINLHIHGPMLKPQVQGGARVARATLNLPNVKYPLNNTFAVVKMEEDKVVVDHFEARSGRKGHIKIRGSLPIAQTTKVR